MFCLFPTIQVARRQNLGEAGRMGAATIEGKRESENLRGKTTRAGG